MSMTYTQYDTIGAVHLLRIKSLDERIVRLAVSVKIDNENASINHTNLLLYRELAISGTKNRNKDDIESYLRRYGIVLHIRTDQNGITYNITVTDEMLPKAINLLEELIYELRVHKKEFDSAQKLLLEEIREDYDDAKDRTETHFLNTLYPKDSMSRRQTLTERKQAAEKATVSDIKAIHTHIKKGEWYISYVGKEASSIHFLAKKLSKTARAVANAIEQHAAIQKTSVFDTVPGKTNVEVRIGNILPITLRDDDYLPFMFGLNVLGKVGGFSGRLMSTVREKEGLTYGIYARTVHENTESTGHWNIFTFFTAKDLEPGLRSTKREINNIVRNGITTRELTVFKEILRNQFLIAHESNSKRLGLYHGALMLGMKESDLIHRNAVLRDVSKSEIHRALKRYIDPLNLVITGAGPVRKNGEGIV